MDESREPVPEPPAVRMEESPGPEDGYAWVERTVSRMRDGITEPIPNESRRASSLVRVGKFVTDTAKPYVQKTLRIWLQGKMVQVVAGLSCPCYVEEVGEIYAEISKRVDGLISAEIDDVMRHEAAKDRRGQGAQTCEDVRDE